ncbi:rod shape-determining protein MreD [Herbaspirillum sp. Sphag1AN]|uniref:rod shape-determining protein MreD n=1 Tax=unclassified Herbaspirillum TaxID=2624150 RepID=UPI00160CB6BA|nr:MULTISPECIES: rod shape-determining protein MreD [unclassified Herbaspirillum]MBB3213591.1 rod shape-determining protein MreD [Herbaspirillum sp. Sphag1AN]MBB3246789.1 rod shape-determining protein MreD [Herbaspirillum sp. Sphag64]
MNDPHYILLPANRLFIFFSLVVAFLLNLLPWGQAVGVPDFVALVLVFWAIHQPRMIGISIAFLMGVLMDVNQATLLGENALAYTLLSYFSIMIHRRVLWFPVGTQALHILPLLLFTQVVQLLVRLIVSGKFPHWYYFSESFVSALLWPLVTWLLLAPQRRAINRDENRPI